jgi:hypothetical protein
MLLMAAIAGCASTSVVRRGQGRDDIHGGFARVLGSLGYACESSPSKEAVICTHAEAVDFTVAYLPHNNNLQIYAGFARSTDVTLADRWRGDCAAVLEDVNRINAEYIPKLSCEEDNLFFTFYTWVPDNGLTDDDIRALHRVLSGSVSDAIHASGMLKSASPSEEPETAPAGLGA